MTEKIRSSQKVTDVSFFVVLTICLWVIDRGVIELDAQIGAPGFYFVGYEVRAVIGDGAVWDTIMVYDTGYKIYHWSGFGPFNWLGLYPLSEFYPP